MQPLLKQGSGRARSLRCSGLAMLRALSSICVLIVAPSIVQSQGWRGILPLHSTCQDVQRTFQTAGCENISFDLKEATVSIAFSDGTCASGWKVSIGTVLSIDVRPKTALKFIDLRVDETKYKKFVDKEDPSLTHYKNYHEGDNITVLPDRTVSFISYGPSAKDEYLRCSQASLDREESSGETGYWKIDEYGPISAKEERARLAAFALRLKADPTSQAYIIAYGGRRSWLGEARNRAACARDYLIRNQRIDAGRIITLDGGHNQESTVSLYNGVKSGSPPVPGPTLATSEVQIISSGKARRTAAVRQPCSKH